jgi:hypothetical protein
MEITNLNVIQSSEQELIDAITGELDWDAIESIFKDKHRLQIEDDVEFRHGDMVVHENQVAYQLDFDVKVILSVVFDRNGRYLSLNTSGDSEASANESEIGHPSLEDDNLDPVETDMHAPESPEESPVLDPEKSPPENVSDMASHIEEIILEINTG